jgi:MinD-like ATPase involved in chromosome partitioning or flagellar assembly
MATAVEVRPTPVPKPPPATRIVFTQGGKGGVGKTGFATMLVDWYAARRVEPALIDMDTENKSRGSLSHFFPGAQKSNIQHERGLDAFVNAIDEGFPVVLADMGAGAGQVAHVWFDAMYESAHESGVAFTAVGIVTPDPASVASVLAWANFLQDRVTYVIVKNALSNPADFSYWENDQQAIEFRELLEPAIISMEYRLAEIEHETRQHGVTVRVVADRQTQIPALKQTASVWRAQAYRRNMFAEFEKIKGLLL